MKKLSDILGYKPIDMHSHFDHGVEGDAAYLREPQMKNIQYALLEDLFVEYDNIGIEAGAFSTYSSVLSTARIPEENEYMREVTEKNERVYQWVVVHPEIEETFRQAEEMLKSPKCLGIKIHPSYHGYEITEHYEKIFSFANAHYAVLLMHPQSILRMPGIADSYPNMKLIIAHLGSEDHVTAVKNSKLGNIYVDTSGSASNLNNVVEYAVKTVGAEKILFGTDTYSAAFQTGRVAFARISDEDKKKILRDNAIKLFPRAFSDLA
jgi:predicted TIM-barrel fold metal-dependent hydrolase